MNATFFPQETNFIRKHYDQDPNLEWERLARHRMEFAISLRAIQEHLPHSPVSILDIGGGPGRYAIELARAGHQVSLVDLSPKNIAFAGEKAKKEGVQLFKAAEGNALDLAAYPDHSFDVVLLMGPLYHLLEQEDREKAVCQARRKLKPDGLIFAAFISRFAPFRDAARRNIESITEHFAYASRMLATGIHDNGDGFTHAYFAHPVEVETLFADNGFQTIHLIGCEGIVSGHEELVNALQGDAWEKWLDLNYRIACDPAALGAADHILYIGKNVQEQENQ